MSYKRLYLNNKPYLLNLQKKPMAADDFYDSTNAHTVADWYDGIIKSFKSCEKQRWKKRAVRLFFFTLTAKLQTNCPFLGAFLLALSLYLAVLLQFQSLGFPQLITFPFSRLLCLFQY